MMKSLFFALLLAAGSLFAETVAYINMDTVFNEYYKTANENIRFEESRQKFMAALELLRNEFEGTRKEYVQAMNDAKNDLLGDKARQDAKQKASLLETRLDQKQEEIINFQKQSVSEIESSQMKATSALVEDLQKQLTRYAAEKHIDLVYEVSGRSSNRIPFLLVYPKDKEITDAFVKQVNAGHEAEKKESLAKLDSLREEAAEKK